MPSPRTAPADPASEKGLWPMLLALCLGFTMSSAYRTVAAMMAVPLQAQWQLTPGQLGLFAAAFHFAFGGLQIVMGLGVDLHGLRKTILWALPLAILGSILAAAAPGFGWLLLGQALIGVGCAPAFLVCTLFIARRFPASRFAALSGLVMGLGGVGLLATGTPLAWLVEHSSWRLGFAVLGAGTALAWLAIFVAVHDEAPAPGQPGGSAALGPALRSYGSLLRMPHSAGILVLASISYAAFITLRGLWLG
ncbi:MAG: MFS transporter, partial [Curvibacter sp.]|nr:MFS transporter [Curvibacter sp.]